MKKAIVTALMLASAGTAFASGIVMEDDLLSVFGESTESTVRNNSFSAGFTADGIASWLSGTSAGTFYSTNKRGDADYSPKITLTSGEDGAYSLGSTWIYKGPEGNVYGLSTSLTDYTTTSSITFSWTYNGTSNSAVTLSEAMVAVVYQTSDGTWDISSNTVTSLNAGELLSVTADVLDLGGDTVYAVLFNQVSGTSSANINAGDVSLTAVYTAIPEPSAFGLLAGAGALALVAARRRRNKR